MYWWLGILGLSLLFKESIGNLKPWLANIIQYIINTVHLSWYCVDIYYLTTTYGSISWRKKPKQHCRKINSHTLGKKNSYQCQSCRILPDLVSGNYRKVNDQWSILEGKFCGWFLRHWYFWSVNQNVVKYIQNATIPQLTFQILYFWRTWNSLFEPLVS